MEYGVLSAEQYYVDKTEVIERELKRFPSIYIEGAAASGKTTAVKMLLERHKDVVSEVVWMEQETEDVRAFEKKLIVIRERMERENIWVIFENMPQKLPKDMAEKIIWLIEGLPESGRVILLGREQLDERLLALLWKRKLELLPQKVLLFTEEEVRTFAEQMGCIQKAGEIYRITGGWAGCVDLFLRMLKIDPERKEQSIGDMRLSYEVDSFIQHGILESLLPDERQLLRYAGESLWLNKTLCQDVFGLPDASDCLKRLEKKGILLFDDRKERWKAASLFKYINSRDVQRKELQTVLGHWYEAQGFVDEALHLYKQAGDEEAYKDCIVHCYQDVPLDAVLQTDVMSWPGEDSRICYLRGVYCYLKQDFSGLRREMKRVEKCADDMAEEIYLNLAYMNIELPLDEWLDLLEKYAKKNGPARLYRILGGSCSYLCGIRDLSGLFCGSRQEIKRKEDIWKKCMGEIQWRAYVFAQMEFDLETRCKDVKVEALRLILQGTQTEYWNIYYARISLLGKMLEIYQDKRMEEEIQKQRYALNWEWNLFDMDGVEALLNLKALWRGEQNGFGWWKYSLQKEALTELNEETWMGWWHRAKGYLYLNRYEKTEEVLKYLIPYLRNYRRIYFLAEALFMMAVIRWKEEKKSRALRYVIESFVITGDHRYVEFYTRYGKNGYEVLESYAEWLQHSEPEKWSRKKKYNYGNVLRMPYADYIEVILRGAKKNRKSYPNMETFAEALTMMERIILQDISQGMTNEEICKAQNLKLPTVKGHLYSLYKKLGVNSRVQAIMKAKELGILK